MGRAEEGLAVLAEALTMGNKNSEHWWDAELYRLKGTLTLQQESKEQGAGSTRSKEAAVRSEERNAENPNPLSDAEACFLKAIEIAQHQRAKSLELRAIMSLVRLRQHQAEEHAPRNTQHVLHDSYRAARHKLNEAHKLLSEVYNWFTEGLDTKDLQEAKALLDEVAERS
jgi:predicted ATPase